MRLALAWCASTARANTPQCDLDLLYHDASGTSTRANLKTGDGAPPGE